MPNNRQTNIGSLPALSSNHNAPVSNLQQPTQTATAHQQQIPQTSRNTILPRDIYNELAEEKNKKTAEMHWNKNADAG